MYVPTYIVGSWGKSRMPSQAGHGMFYSANILTDLCVDYDVVTTYYVLREVKRGMRRRMPRYHHPPLVESQLFAFLVVSPSLSLSVSSFFKCSSFYRLIQSNEDWCCFLTQVFVCRLCICLCIYSCALCIHKVCTSLCEDLERICMTTGGSLTLLSPGAVCPHHSRGLITKILINQH